MFITMKLLLFLCLVILSLSSVTNLFELSKLRHRRSFFLLPPIFTLPQAKRKHTVTRIPCMGDCGLHGYCTSKSECSAQSGTASGLCTDSTVCCLNIVKCGTVVNANLAFFVNPGYPGAYYGGSLCSITIAKPNSNIRQVRLDFIEFSLIQPSADGRCINDFFTVVDCLSEKICGENANQHIYVDFGERRDKIILSVDTNAAENVNRKWIIKVTQLTCNDTIAPSGCLMYYTGTSGVVSSFNYGVLNPDETARNRQILGLNYGVCIQSKDEYCSLEWSRTKEPYSFTVSGNNSISSDVFDTRGTRGEACNNNFVMIANAYKNNTAVNVDRFCGRTFDTITTTSKPYLLRVVTGQNITEDTKDSGTRGFRLHFRQLPCHR